MIKDKKKSNERTHAHRRREINKYIKIKKYIGEEGLSQGRGGHYGQVKGVGLGLASEG